MKQQHSGQTRGRVVVIGAGIGGLAAAVRLAHAGLDVTVVETRSGPGGKMRTVPSAAGPIDAGPTVLTMRHVFDDLFTAAGTQLEDHLHLTAQPILARHWWPDGSTLDLHADPIATEAAIGSFAGARAAAEFRRFHHRTAQLFTAFDAPMMQAPSPHAAALLGAALRTPAIWPTLLPGMTLARSLALGFQDPRLRQLFGRYATYVGGSPYRAPAVLGLIWQAEARGVWAVQGGMHRLATALSDLARAGGARLRFGVGALRLRQNWGRITEVQLTDGTSLPCDCVVFNGDPAALAEGLLGPVARPAVTQNAVAPRSLSAWVWAFAATASGPDLIHHNVFFGKDPRQEFGPIAQGQRPADPTLYVCAQDRHDPTAATPSGPERFEIIMNAPAKSQPAPHEDQECHTLTFTQLARFGLQFSPTTPISALTPPAEFAKMFPASQGALYGRSPNSPLAALQRPGPRTSVAGLYLAGGGAHPGAGVPMAARSGQHAAAAIMHDLSFR